MEFNFYQSLPSLLNKTICQLADKSYNTSCKVLIVIKDHDLLSEIDKLLWTYSRKTFLPHATKNDPYQELQPIYITDKIENLNNSSILFLIKPVAIEIDIINYKFERIFVIYESEEFIQENLTVISMLSKKLYTINLFKQQLDNTWVKKEISNIKITV